MTGSSYERGKTLAKERRFEEAAPLFEEAARERSDSPEVWLALAACYFRLDRHDEFREAIRAALSLDPDHAPTKRFLRRTTGSDIVTAADTGRPKIVVEEGADPFAGFESEQKAKTAGGCLGGMLGLAILAILAFFFR